MKIVTLVNRVLAGIATPEERDTLNSWRSQSKANEEEFESLKLLWENSDEKIGVEKSDPHFYDGWEKIRRLITLRKQEKRKVNRRNRYLIGLALAVAALMSLVLKPSTSFLAFQNKNLGVIVRGIETTYDVSISIDKKEMLSCQLTTAFYGDLDEETVVRSIADAMSMNYSILGPGRFLLSGGSCVSK